MNLKIGSTGDNVKKLQVKLLLNPDGNFGAVTETAVKKWQKENALNPDGIVSEIVWNKMFNIVVEQKSTGSLNLDKLKGHVPISVLNQIPNTITSFGINTPLRLAHFLAQCAHESGGFKLVQENLNYSANGLMEIFGKYFPTKQLAEQYQRKPVLIASKVYGNRMGNGDEKTKEGFKFRGRGYIQLTGKENYTAFGKSINEDIVSNPDKVATHYPLLSAAWFFTKNGLHKIADKGATNAIVTQISKRVNGGTIGLEDRIKYFKKFYELLKP